MAKEEGQTAKSLKQQHEELFEEYIKSREQLEKMVAHLDEVRQRLQSLDAEIQSAEISKLLPLQADLRYNQEYKNKLLKLFKEQQQYGSKVWFAGVPYDEAKLRKALQMYDILFGDK